MLLNRKETTALLSELTEKLINPQKDVRIYSAKEVTFDYGTQNQVRVDYMRFKPLNNTVSGIEKGDFYCYEIKSSVEDFNSKNGHNMIGDYNYYVMPAAVYENVKNKIPYRTGVYVFNPLLYQNKLISVKKAKRSDRKKSALEMLLMMFRSANRQLNKGLKER